MTALEQLTQEFVLKVRELVEQEVRSTIAESIVDALGGVAIDARKLTTQRRVVQGTQQQRKVTYTYTFSEKPCPVCGKLNRGRRWRYYCKDHLAQDPHNQKA
jgi:NMD protein affecting ribosome stability and mRNA decay